MREAAMLLRLKRLETTQRKKVALLATMISGFEKMAAGLAQQIASEEERTKIKDVRNVAYSTLAASAAVRRGNLMNSIADAEANLDAAKRELMDVTAQLRDAEMAYSQARPTRMNVGSEGCPTASHELG